MLQTKLKVLDLFSGIGGFSLGLESTGFFETIAFVEKDEFCQKVLKKNFKNTPIEGDIRNVKGERYAADVVTGGFPCQPFSVAGKRKGTDDDRYLWDETIRVVRECKPKWFIGENVEGLVNIQEGMVLRQVQDDLEKEGFEVQCIIIPASGIGAWHQRKRIWIMGYSEHNGHTSTKIRESSNQTNDNCKEGEYQTIKSEGTSTPRNNENVRMDVSNANTRFGIRENEEIQTRGNTFNNGSSTNVSDTISSLRRRRGAELKSGENKIREFYSKEEEQSEQHIRSKAIGHNVILGERENFTNSNSKGSQGHRLQSNNLQKSNQSKINTDSNFTKQQTWWQTQSSLCGVPNGVSYGLDKNRANRIKALGNSIVPQIARELGKAIIEAEKDV